MIKNTLKHRQDKEKRDNNIYIIKIYYYIILNLKI